MRYDRVGDGGDALSSREKYPTPEYTNTRTESKKGNI